MLLLFCEIGSRGPDTGISDCHRCFYGPEATRCLHLWTDRDSGTLVIHSHSCYEWAVSINGQKLGSLRGTSALFLDFLCLFDCLHLWEIKVILSTMGWILPPLFSKLPSQFFLVHLRLAYLIVGLSQPMYDILFNPQKCLRQYKAVFCQYYRSSR